MLRQVTRYFVAINEFGLWLFIVVTNLTLGRLVLPIGNSEEYKAHRKREGNSGQKMTAEGE